MNLGDVQVPAVRTRPAIAVVDYGAGNLVSIEQALVSVGATVRRATGPSDFEDVSGIVVPGVGAAGPAMRRLEGAGLVEPIREWVATGRPLLGVCLGLQLLFETSEEDGSAMLGVLAGRAVRLPDAPTLPHIGWNAVTRLRHHVLFDGIAPDAPFYFVHSYAPLPNAGDESVVLGQTVHGRPFVSAIARGNLAAVQFHPERSGADGILLLANWVGLVAASPSGRD